MMERRQGLAILCDIDATVTDYHPGGVDFREAVFAMFAEEVAAARGMGAAEARHLLEDYANNQLVWWDYPDFIVGFGLDPAKLWARMRHLHLELLRVYPDAVAMVKSLCQEGRDLYIVSNNPVTGCLLKLELAGLADLRGSPFFRRVFGTNVTRGMKSQPPMWRRVMASLGTAPEDMVTIGDSVKEDCLAPREAGIGRSIIVDRTAARPVEERDGYVAVNSLELVNELLRRKRAL